MGMICVVKATGQVREWARHGTPPSYDPVQHELLAADAPPDPGTRWDGSTFVPLPAKTTAEKDSQLQIVLDAAGGQVMQALVTALTKKGVISLTEIRAEYRSLAP